MIEQWIRTIIVAFSTIEISRHSVFCNRADTSILRSWLLLLPIAVFSFFVPYSPASADEVPTECAELYTANGAIPNTESCVLLASTISVGLGNWYCRTFAADTIDDFCGDTQNDEWVDLTQVETSYKFEDSIESNGAGFAHQFYCIADKSCTAYDQAGDQSWSSGFVKHLFDRMITGSELPESVKLDCWDWMSNDACFKWKGYRAHSAELIDGFFTYCNLVRTNVNYNRWDENHNTFLRLGVSACLDEVMATDNLNFIETESITGKAVKLRELAQKACLIQNFIRSGGSVTGDDTPLNRLLARVAVDVVVPDNLRIPDPTKADYYDPFWDTVGNLTVSVSDDTFFVKPGEQLTLTASRVAADGSSTEVPTTELVLFELMTNEDHVDITPDGVLTVNSVASPFSVTSDSNVVLIVASIGSERGIAQVMIQDDDTDGDTLVDSYEDSAGFNRAVPDDLQADSNNDGISDLDQILSDVKVAAEQSNNQLAGSLVGGDATTTEDGGSGQIGDEQSSSQPATDTTSSGGSMSYWLLMMLLMQRVLSRKFEIKNSRRSG